MSKTSSSALTVFLPENTLAYFEITDWSKDESDVRITLEEKDEPPMTDRAINTHIVSKGFHNITITDFPIRGKRALLTFRRRYWQIEGQKTLLKRDIQLTFPGTQLEKEFAAFLKDTGGRDANLALLYRPFTLPPDQGV